MYVKIHYHIGQYLANDLLEFFLNNNIIIIDYRAQSYENPAICLEDSLQ